MNTRNLGEQAEQEFKRFQPQDDNRLFPELYGVTRLSRSFIPYDSQVYISTVQRLYSILKGTELNERDEEEDPVSKKWKPKEPMPVVYNERTPIELFDFIVIDECHQSIYNLWKQVLVSSNICRSERPANAEILLSIRWPYQSQNGISHPSVACAHTLD